MKKINKKSGFTLIEILVVIGIIAILAAVVLVAINPARQFAQARNSQRQSNVNTLLNAVGQFMADNNGRLDSCYGYANVTGTGPYNINSTSTPSGNINLYECLVPKYIAQLPGDPSVGKDLASPATFETGYTFASSTNGRITVCAPEAAREGAIPTAESICITR